MMPAADKMRELIMRLNLNIPKVPIVSNVTASKIQDVKKIKELLVEQIYKKVRWREIIELMLFHNVNNFIEIGPGKSLSGMLKRFKKDIFIKSFNDLNDINIEKC